MELQMRVDLGTEPVTVSDTVFAAEYKPALIHQVVTAYLAAGRAGTKSQRSRARVRGGKSKPYRQKGTGRARAGTARSPLWRSGGVTFAAEPKDWSQKVNRKMYRGAMRSILSELVRNDRLVPLSTLEIQEPRTKLLATRINELGLGKALIVVPGRDDPLFLAARNIPGLAVVTAAQVDPVRLIAHDHVVITGSALRSLEERLA